MKLATNLRRRVINDENFKTPPFFTGLLTWAYTWRAREKSYGVPTKSRCVWNWWDLRELCFTSIMCECVKHSWKCF